ncbi:hypothetical protein [Marinobacter sp. DUT-1]|uniref:hypothetical protein n=1 Tax=Marinobacter sp. DUT-1 TaxID=3412037 RepID=UPI003D17E374
MQDAQSNARFLAPGFLIFLVLVFFSGLSLPADDGFDFGACERGACLISGEVAGDGGHEAGLSTDEESGKHAPVLVPCHSVIPSRPQITHCASFPVLPQAPPLA